MADTNMTPETNSAITQSSEVQNALLAKVAAIVETAKNHTHVCVLALTLAVAGAAHAEEPIVLASSALGTSGDAQGEIIDSSLNSAQIESQIIIIEADSAQIQNQITIIQADTAQIQNQITIIETNVAELEAKGMDNFSDDDWDTINLLQDQLIELERSKTALSKEIIELERSKTARYKEIIEFENEKQAVYKALRKDLEGLAKEFKEITPQIK
jgi:DNA repair exonuclease SbcCD ATPase subunit